MLLPKESEDGFREPSSDVGCCFWIFPIEQRRASNYLKFKNMAGAIEFACAVACRVRRARCTPTNS